MSTLFSWTAGGVDLALSAEPLHWPVPLASASPRTIRLALLFIVPVFIATVWIAARWVWVGFQPLTTASIETDKASEQWREYLKHAGQTPAIPVPRSPKIKWGRVVFRLTWKVIVFSVALAIAIWWAVLLPMWLLPKIGDPHRTIWHELYALIHAIVAVEFLGKVVETLREEDEDKP